MSEMKPEVDPVTKVAQHLSAIEDLSCHLESQAIAKANDRELPGGSAMVALAGVANIEAWQNIVDTSLRLAYAYDEEPPEIDDDDTFEPPLQTLCFWSEQLRREHGDEYDKRPTISSEAGYIRFMLNWMWENEPHWDDFVDDIRKARTRLENMLHAGVRVAFRGAPCLYDECKGARLIRKTVPTRDEQGNKAWRLTDWHCPRCKRSWDEKAYARNIYAAVERSHFDDLGTNETWCTVSRAARRVDRPQGTIRSWISRGEVAAACLLDGSRESRTFVLLDDVVQRDRLAKGRHAAWLAARKAKQVG